MGGDWSGNRYVSTVGAADEEWVGRSAWAGPRELAPLYITGGGGGNVYGVEGAREGGAMNEIQKSICVITYRKETASFLGICFLSRFLS